MKKILIISAIALFALFVGVQVVGGNQPMAETSDDNIGDINQPDSLEKSEKNPKLPDVRLLNNGAL